MSVQGEGQLFRQEDKHVGESNWGWIICFTSERFKLFPSSSATDATFTTVSSTVATKSIWSESTAGTAAGMVTDTSTGTAIGIGADTTVDSAPPLTGSTKFASRSSKASGPTAPVISAVVYSNLGADEAANATGNEFSEG